MNPVTELTSRLEQAFSPHVRAEGEPGPKDAMAAAICDVARHYGIAVEPATLTAGLPLVNGLLPLDHVQLAADNAGLQARLDRVRLGRLLAHEFPLVIVPQGAAAPSIIWSRNADQTVSMSTPGQSEPNSVSLASLPSHKIRIVRLTPAGNSAVEDLGLPASDQNWLLSGFKGSAGVFAEAIVASIAVNLLALALPLYTMNVLDRVVPNSATDTLWALSMGVLLAACFDFLIKTLRSHAVDAVSRRADVRLANLIFGRLLGAKLADKSASTGARANTLREFETLREFFNSITMTTLGDMPFLIVFVLVLAIISGPLALVVIAAIPLLLGVSLIIERALTRASRDSFKNAAQKNAVAVEAISGLETIKASGAESWAASRWEKSVVDHVRNGLVIRHLSTIGLNLIGFGSIMVQVAIVIIGCHMVAAGELTSGALVAATMLASRALAPLNQLALLVTRMHQARIAWQTLSQIVRAPQERPAGATLIGNRVISGRLELENVVYRYEKDAAPALDSVSFAIAPGERVGIIGGIGSGKSTLLKLAVALHDPASGRVMLDGTAVTQYDPHALRRQVGICLQGADLFEGSIRSLSDHMRGRTLVIVTHRPAPLDIVDRLIVLESGRKVADGPKSDVMRALREAADRSAGSTKADTKSNGQLVVKTVAERQA